MPIFATDTAVGIEPINELEQIRIVQLGEVRRAPLRHARNLDVVDACVRADRVVFQLYRYIGLVDLAVTKVELHV